MGTTASGQVGDVVKVTVGITNKGPEQYTYKGAIHLKATWTFTPPPGTETVRPPANELGTVFKSGGAIGADRCASVGSDSPFGPLPYECFSVPTFEPGASSKGTFYL